MKKLLLSVALFSFVGLTTISAAPCEDGKKCDKKECTAKKDKKECTANAKKSKACCAKSSAKSCHSAKSKTNESKSE